MGTTTTALYHNSSGRNLSLGTNETERLTITGGGNVGIGDPSAPNKLSVKDTGDLYCRFTGGSTFSLYQNNTDGSVIFSQDHGDTASENRFIWQTGGGVERMRIDTSNASLLTVAGGASFADAVTVNGQVTINPDADSQVIIGNGGTNASTVFAGAGDDLYIGGGASSNMRIFNGTAVQFYGTVDIDLTLNVDGNAAFGGDVTIAKSTPTLTFNNLAGGGLDPILEASGTNFNIKTSSVTPLSINLSTQAATFAGDITTTQGTSAVRLGEYSNGAVIWMDGSNGDFTGGDYFGIHAYGTTDLAFSYAGSTKMTLKNDGKVGIGNASPWTNLVVSGSGSSTTVGNDASYRMCLTNTDQTNNNHSLISFNDGADQGGSASMGCRYTDHTNNYGLLMFATRDSDGFLERVTINSSGSVSFTQPLYIPDSKKINLGSSQDLQLYHDGSNSYISDSNVSSDLIIRSNHILLQAPSGENMIFCNEDAEVKLYYNNSAKLQTLDTGVNVIGGISASGTSAVTCDGATKALAISNVGSTSATTMSIKTSGTASGASSLDIHQVNTIYGPSAIQFFYGSTSTTAVGYIRAASSSTTYSTSSDYRLKENVVELTGALDRIGDLKPKRFNFINNPDVTVDGFLAHEAQEVVPQAITGEKDEEINGKPSYQGIDHGFIVPLLTAAIKELKAQNEDLLARVKALESK